VTFEVAAAGEELFLALDQQGEALEPLGGKVACIGRFDRFDVENVNQVTVIGPGNRQLPLVVDGSSIFEEFGKVVAFRFYVLLPPDSARPGETTLELRWGADVEATNSRVERLKLNPKLRESYRSLRLAGTGGGRGRESTASILVIADSTADYHFLWYLVPIGLIFALLTVRKLLLRTVTTGGGGSGGGPVSRDPR